MSGRDFRTGLAGFSDEARFGPDARERGVVFLVERKPGERGGGGLGVGVGVEVGKGRKEVGTLMGCPLKAV